MLRKIAVLILTLLLVLSLFGASGVWALDRGPMDAEHVTESADEAKVYDAIHQEVHKQIESEDISLPFPGLEDDISPIIKSVITVEWIQSESERNIHNLYDHLENDEPLNLTIDLQSRESEIEDVLREELSLRDLNIDRLDRLTDDETSYQAELADMRAQLRAAIGVDPENGFGIPLLQDLLEDEESYEATRTAIQDDIVQQGLAEIQADDGFGNDRMALMYADSTEYENEQQEFRETQKERIQEETDEELSDEELEAAYEDQIDEIIDAATTAAGDRIDLDDGPAGAEDRVEDIATLKAEALATDMTHDVFTEQYDDIVAAIEDDILDELAADPSPIADDLHSQFEAELADAGAPEPVADEATGVVDVTVEALTTDMSYETYQEEYDAAAADVETVAFEYLSENRDEYDDEIQAAAFGDAGLDDIPAAMEDEVDDFIQLMVDAVVDDIPYAEFMDEFEEREDNLAAALAEAIFAEDMLPTTIDISEEIVNEAGEELEMLGTIFGLVLPVAIGLTLLSLLLFGGIYVVLQNLATTAIVGGGVSFIVGGSTYLAAIIIPDVIRDVLNDIEAPESLVVAMGDFIEHVFFVPFAGQGLVLVGIGVLLGGVGIALRYDLLDQVREKRNNAD